MSKHLGFFHCQALLAVFIAGSVLTPLHAQITPSAADMVEQLKTQPPRTRSLRNLTIESITRTIRRIS